MKRILFIVGIAAVSVSCGKSKGEKMLYEYQKENVKSGLNMDVEDLEFKIHEIKEVDQITAADSAAIYKQKLNDLWYGEDSSQEGADTLTFEFVATELDTMKKSYQQLILTNITLDREYENYELKRKRDQYIDAYFDVVGWQTTYDKFQKKPDSVLSVKYQASYSINNPMLNNNKQTFDKYFYSDPKNSRFIKEEMVAETGKEKEAASI